MANELYLLLKEPTVNRRIVININANLSLVIVSHNLCILQPDKPLATGYTKRIAVHGYYLTICANLCNLCNLCFFCKGAREIPSYALLSYSPFVEMPSCQKRKV